MSKRIIALALFAGLAATACQQSSNTSSSSTSGSTETSARVLPGSSATPAPAEASPAPATSAATPSLPGSPIGDAKLHSLASGLKYYELKVGDGAMAEPGMTAFVDYTGWLTDGTQFDTSVGKQPYPFQLGATPRQVIQGWEEGVKGMRIGGKRKLVVPPDMAYGDRGYPGAIPPNATLVFDVELKNVR